MVEVNDDMTVRCSTSCTSAIPIGEACFTGECTQRVEKLELSIEPSLHLLERVEHAQDGARRLVLLVGHLAEIPADARAVLGHRMALSQPAALTQFEGHVGIHTDAAAQLGVQLERTRRVDKVWHDAVRHLGAGELTREHHRVSRRLLVVHQLFVVELAIVERRRRREHSHADRRVCRATLLQSFHRARVGLDADLVDDHEEASGLLD
mmetsp:Transcript_49457/g.129037  ORF Transcript_49457/g.129037 Transcript_49457/m.129037 type:complete len:208 (+) Transcript_49457:289-912(+)